MANPNKAKGTRWETEVARFLGETVDPEVYKPRQSGYLDLGDIHAAGSVVQAKDWRDWQSAVRVGLDGAQQQAANAGKWPGWAVVKRARRPVGDAYAVFRLADAAELLRLARIGQQTERRGMAPRPIGEDGPPAHDDERLLGEGLSPSDHDL